MQCLRTLDKQSRGVCLRGGRPVKSSEVESRLVSDTALSLALCGGNVKIAQTLGQKVRPPRVHWDDLPSHSLPNPVLALSEARKDQLLENVDLINQWFGLSPGQDSRRCILAIDHTYLQARFAQGIVGGVPGLLGGAWAPGCEDAAFVPFSSLTGESFRNKKANLMLECLVWDPCADRRLSLSLASMPMKLGRGKKGDRTNANQGNIVS